VADVIKVWVSETGSVEDLAPTLNLPANDESRVVSLAQELMDRFPGARTIVVTREDAPTAETT
jgi:hypothetical protein